jgi:ATP-dependent DNA helicase PIF1
MPTHSDQLTLDTSWARGGEDPRIIDAPANYGPTPPLGGKCENQSAGVLPGLLVSSGQSVPSAPDRLPLRSVVDDDDQQRAIAIMQSGRNTFLTGMAGTGKSHTLLTFISQSFRPVEACATTGIAALNLQDQFMSRAGIMLPARTVYSWAGIGLGPAYGQTNEQYFEYLDRNMTRSRRGAYARIRRAETLIIDEISMLPGRILNYLDFHMRRIRETNRPFGGVQIIAVGDFHQLPPVAKNGIYDWAFMSQAWQVAGFQFAALRTIRRQSDPIFIDALNAFRVGRISTAVADVLAARVQKFVNRRVPRLMTHNSQVNKWNAYQLGEIDGPEKIYNAEFSGAEADQQFLAKHSVTPSELLMKCGARVMVTANISDGAGGIVAVNGQCGTVRDLRLNSVMVALDNGAEVEIAQHNWSMDPQNSESATMTQIPLRPAYAMTIHKSQGLTLDKAHIDIRAACEPGQAYVALSRLRSLSGLYLKEWISGVVVCEAAINFYRKNL